MSDPVPVSLDNGIQAALHLIEGYNGLPSLEIEGIIQASEEPDVGEHYTVTVMTNSVSCANSPIGLHVASVRYQITLMTIRASDENNNVYSAVRTGEYPVTIVALMTLHDGSETSIVRHARFRRGFFRKFE